MSLSKVYRMLQPCALGVMLAATLPEDVAEGIVVFPG
jgi:hypothetical protein